MLKKIPSEQPERSGREGGKKSSAKVRRAKHAPYAVIQKKNSAVDRVEYRIIHLVGAKMINYGKKMFKTNEEYLRLIRDVQVSVLCLQKQQRQFLRGKQKKK